MKFIKSLKRDEIITGVVTSAVASTVGGAVFGLKGNIIGAVLGMAAGVGVKRTLNNRNAKASEQAQA